MRISPLQTHVGDVRGNETCLRVPGGSGAKKPHTATRGACGEKENQHAISDMLIFDIVLLRPLECMKWSKVVQIMQPKHLR